MFDIFQIYLFLCWILGLKSFLVSLHIYLFTSSSCDLVVISYVFQLKIALNFCSFRFVNSPMVTPSFEKWDFLRIMLPKFYSCMRMTQTRHWLIFLVVQPNYEDYSCTYYRVLDWWLYTENCVFASSKLYFDCINTTWGFTTFPLWGSIILWFL